MFKAVDETCFLPQRELIDEMEEFFNRSDLENDLTLKERKNDVSQNEPNGEDFCN